MNNHDGTLVCRVIGNPLTTVTIFGSRKSGDLLLTSLAFERRGSFMGRRAKKSNDTRLLGYAKAIGLFLEGKRNDLSELPLDLDCCTPFAKKVLLVARKIPWGQTVSYAELARKAGNPRAVRAAASVMRNNPFPLIIPCHRVIKSDGHIGGFMGKKTGDAVELKKKLLKREVSVQSIINQNTRKHLL